MVWVHPPTAVTCATAAPDQGFCECLVSTACKGDETRRAWLSPLVEMIPPPQLSVQCRTPCKKTGMVAQPGLFHLKFLALGCIIWE